MPLLADKMALAASGAEISASIAMGQNNTIQAELIIFQMASGTASLTLQGSCDGITWRDISTASNLTLGYNAPAAFTGVGDAFVRAKVLAAAASKTILSLGFYPSSQ